MLLTLLVLIINIVYFKILVRRIETSPQLNLKKMF